jgi:hypothetical protein
MGLSLLSTVGLPELIAYTKAEYVNIAIKLANDLESLQRLRAGMRERMQASPLMDAPTFTGHLEAIYRQLPAKASSPEVLAGLEALAGQLPAKASSPEVLAGLEALAGQLPAKASSPESSSRTGGFSRTTSG